MYFEDFWDTLSKGEQNEFLELIRGLKFERLKDLYPNRMDMIFIFFLDQFGGNLDECADFFLVRNNVDINQISKDLCSEMPGATLLTQACEFHKVEVISQLIELGADVETKEKNGYSPLEMIIVGHAFDSQFDIERMMLCIDALVNAGCRKVLRSSVLEQCKDLHHMKEPNPVLEFVKECDILNE
jgi:hypothetical protein